MKVAVVGLGKIGLPLAVQIASRGHDVVGADIQASVVEAVNAGDPPFPGEAGLSERLQSVLAERTLRATQSTEEAARDSDAVVVVVPLVVDAAGAPDFSALDTATAAVGASTRPGVLVSYETTLPVGTTRRRFAARLEAVSGLRCGVDLFVCHSPERVSSGRVFADLRRYPKLVGGVDASSTKRGVAFYESVLEFDPRPELPQPNGVWDLGSAEAAELAKLAETTYRDLNIAYANELATAAETLGIDFQDVITACNSQPFSHIHQPGIAVGGHCIPVYPYFMLDSVPGVRLPALAREINRSVPAHAVRSLGAVLGGLEGQRVVVFGLAYRGGVKEHAFSGAFDLVRLLREQRADVVVHDPLYSDDELQAVGLDPFHLGDAATAAIVQTDHETYRQLDPSDVRGVRAVFDGRRVLDPARWSGVHLLRLGAPRT
jgi:nucleotide sugar dehydrogenase